MRNANPPDFVGRIQRLEEQVRQLRLRVRGHAESKTFIVNGAINNTVYIPPAIVAINPTLKGTPEDKQLVELHGIVRVGYCYVRWWLNNETEIYHSHYMDTNGEAVVLPEAVIIRHGDWIRPQILSASSDCSDLSAAMIFATNPV